MSLITVGCEKVNFIFLRLHLLNKIYCWQVSSDKIKLNINEMEMYIFCVEPFKTLLLF